MSCSLSSRVYTTATHASSGSRSASAAATTARQKRKTAGRAVVSAIAAAGRVATCARSATSLDKPPNWVTERVRALASPSSTKPIPAGATTHERISSLLITPSGPSIRPSTNADSGVTTSRPAAQTRTDHAAMGRQSSATARAASAKWLFAIRDTISPPASASGW